MFSKYRKALAAFILPFLSLPFGDWVGGLDTFQWSFVGAAFMTGLISAVGVFLVPNSE